jgi:hypothetical protein
MTWYEVEWVESVPNDDCGDADLDRAEHRRKFFKTVEEAREFAKKVIVGKPWECASITPFVEISFEQYRDSDGDTWMRKGHFYEYTGEPEEISS